MAEHARANRSHTPVGREGTVAAHERKAARTPRGWLPRWGSRRGTTAVARSCTVLKVVLAEAHAERRQLVRTPPIDSSPVNGGARRIDRPSWAQRHGRGVDDDVLIVRFREHHRRDKCLATEVVREECPPGL